MVLRADCAAVIPCLNEEGTIGQLVTRIHRYVATVFVVDDASRDRTAAVAAEAGAEVLRHSVNQGKGAALQTAWKCALERGFAWSLTLDGDGQHAAEDIPSFFESEKHTGAALVIGNRMMESNRMPKLRRAVNLWMSRRLSKVAGQSLPDSQCGFRLVSLRVLKGLRILSTHFEIESEVLLAFARAGHRIEFVPIQVLYKNEQSKIHPVRDSLRWLRWYRAIRRPGSRQ